uniref:N-acetyltransferase domain-containing protein n=1 Tax=Glossina austeni TaxID=7395 RepID=A0A1A9UJS5_GLOAU
MQPFIVVRNYREDDELKCQELVRDYIMSFFKKSFYCFCFREITLQFIVITWAILFIFLGVPLTFCALCVPGCIFFLFSGTYFSFYAKAVELMKTKPNQALVAECYEPYIFRLKPNEVTYQIFMDDAPYEPSFKNKFRKKIIATVSVKSHSSIYNAAWIYRFAVAPNYSFQKVAEPMFGLILKNCIQLGYQTIESTISEWQENERDFYDNLGFATRQIYHKQIIGNSLSVMKTQLTFNLRKDEALQKQN